MSIFSSSSVDRAVFIRKRLPATSVWMWFVREGGKRMLTAELLERQERTNKESLLERYICIDPACTRCLSQCVVPNWLPHFRSTIFGVPSYILKKKRTFTCFLSFLDPLVARIQSAHPEVVTPSFCCRYMEARFHTWCFDWLFAKPPRCIIADGAQL